MVSINDAKMQGGNCEEKWICYEVKIFEDGLC
jgi:hypothetical protein